MEQKAWASRSKMPSLPLIIAVFVTSILGLISSLFLIVLSLGSLALLIYTLKKQGKKGFKPQSDTYKTLEKIKKKRQKTDENKHKHISDQVSYIKEVWGYSKEQDKIIEKFINTRAYSEEYNKMSASFLPQIIDLIDRCNEKEQKGCKRDVSKRLKELTTLMKEQLQKQNSLNNENLEVGLEVYDELLKAKR